MKTFDGQTYVEGRDKTRLMSQLRDVKKVMIDGQWLTLEQISCITGHPQASVSARIRDLRKPKFGGHTVERRHVRRGLFQYKLDLI